MTDEGEIPYDYLVLSAGSVNNFFGMASAEKRCFALKDLGEALALRNHILRRFEEAAWDGLSRSWPGSPSRRAGGRRATSSDSCAVSSPSPSATSTAGPWPP